MSDISEAIARAEKRLESMTEEQRLKFHILILREELQRQVPTERMDAPHAK